MLSRIEPEFEEVEVKSCSPHDEHEGKEICIDRRKRFRLSSNILRVSFFLFL